MSRRLPPGERVFWALVGCAVLTAAVVLAFLVFQPAPADPAPRTTPTVRVTPPVLEDACRAFLAYAGENGFPYGPDDPSYVEWARLHDACERSR